MSTKVRRLDRLTRAHVGFGASVIAIAITLAGCGSSSDETTAEQQKAQSLVSATQSAGVAPNLTVEIAESLYGTDAPAACGAFEGGLSTSAQNLLFGNPSNRRPKTITTDSVTYGRLVIQTYCPDELGYYDAAVKGIDPIESDDS